MWRSIVYAVNLNIFEYSEIVIKNNQNCCIKIESKV